MEQSSHNPNRLRAGTDRLRAAFGGLVLRAARQLPPVQRFLEELEAESRAMQGRMNELETENEALSAKVERLMYDDVVNNFLNRQGLKEFVISNQDLEAELQSGNCGLLFLDVRFLKFINDFYGYQHGDDFLKEAGGRIDEVFAARVRTVSQTVQEDLRREGSPESDIRVRYGGDEFVLIIRNVSPAQLTIVAQRIAVEFSVERALGEADRKEVGVPLVASLASAHAANIDPEVRQAAVGHEILTMLLSQLKDQQEHEKRQQYDEMWAAIQQKTYTPLQRPSSDRDIAKEFIKICYPLYFLYMHHRQYGSKPDLR